MTYCVAVKLDAGLVSQLDVLRSPPRSIRVIEEEFG